MPSHAYRDTMTEIVGLHISLCELTQSPYGSTDRYLQESVHLTPSYAGLGLLFPKTILGPHVASSSLDPCRDQSLSLPGDGLLVMLS
jgi:hypothetical protein